MTTAAEQSKDEPGSVCMDQARVIDFLQNPTSYVSPVEQVTRIDTHAAMIFLAGDHAYKIKRAVKLPYLDFRTLQERLRVCQRELEFNRPQAPQIYEEVVPIVQNADGTLQLGGTGKVVEWVLRMRRFPQDQILDRLAVDGALDAALMAKLAATLVEAHAQAPAAKQHDGVSGLREVIATTIAAFNRSTDTICATNAARYESAIEATFESNKVLLARRAASGFVRRCHGDLHLRNIVVLDGQPTLFDAIEFDENIATIDTLYDLAFLLMDLWRRSLRPQANVLMNRYIYLSGHAFEPQALRLLPLFLALRAAVRAMVALDVLSFQTGTAYSEKRDEAAEYLRLAKDFLHPEPPVLIAVGGLSGTGKSTQAAAIAPNLGAAPGAYVVRSDVERKKLFEVAPETPLGSDAYTPEISRQVYEQVCSKASEALNAGHSVVADAVFSEPWQRNAIEDVAAARNVFFTGIWLEADEDILIKRVSHRTGDASDADATVVRHQHHRDPGPVTWHRIDASSSPDDVRDQILEHIDAYADLTRDGFRNANT